MGHQKTIDVKNIVKCMIKCTQAFSKDRLYANGMCQKYKVNINAMIVNLGFVSFFITRIVLLFLVRNVPDPILKKRGKANK